MDIHPFTSKLVSNASPKHLTYDYASLFPSNIHGHLQQKELSVAGSVLCGNLLVIFCKFGRWHFHSEISQFKCQTFNNTIRLECLLIMSNWERLCGLKLRGTWNMEFSTLWRFIFTLWNFHERCVHILKRIWNTQGLDKLTFKPHFSIGFVYEITNHVEVALQTCRGRLKSWWLIHLMYPYHLTMFQQSTSWNKKFQKNVSWPWFEP